MAARPKPLIALTMGDPAGIGPEVCLHLLTRESIHEICTPVIFGDAVILKRVAAVTSLPFEAEVIKPASWRARRKKLAGPAVLDLPALNADRVTPGEIGAHTGAAAFAYVDASIEAAIAGEVAAVTTGPINKEALHMAGIHFPGHTEIFAARTNSLRWCMMQYSEEITCTFVTVHVGYVEAASMLTRERILEVIELTAEGLKRIRGKEPRILVCGLNPHAGEHGLFGNGEEERIIIPAIEDARAKGLDVEGPLPPDTAFVPAKRKAADAVVCMYHDQGHIPVKALAFDSAVNTTLGLPVVRTSVDHGTALDIAWQGKANPGSMIQAVRLAVKLAAKG